MTLRLNRGPILALVLGWGLLIAAVESEPGLTGPLWLGIVSLILDVGSPSLGSFGYLALGFPWWMAFAQNGSPSGAALLLSTGLLLRALRRPHRNKSGRAVEFTSDFLPGAAALAAAQYLSAWGVLVPSAVYLACWLAMPDVLASGLAESEEELWRRTRSDLFPAVLALAGLAPIVSNLVPVDPRLAGLAIVTVPLMQVAALLSRERQAGRDLESRQVRLERQRRDLVEDSDAVLRMQRGLEFKLETYALVDRLLQSLPEEPGVQRVAQSILKMVHSRLECDSVVIFWKEGQDLVPLAWLTPNPERMDRAALLGAEERIVERACQSRRLTTLTNQDRNKSRIFPEEYHAVAAPLRNRGALYAGRRAGEWQTEQLEFLQIVSSHALVALESSMVQQANLEALGRETQSREALEGLVGRLTQVLDHSFEMMRLRRPAELLEQTGAGLEQLLTHDVRLVSAGTLKASKGEVDEPAVQALVEAVRQNNRPLLVDRFDRTRFTPPAPGVQSALIVPVPSEAGMVGGIVLGSREPARFHREDQDLLTLLAAQLGSVFVAVRLYAELEQAHTALKHSQEQLIQSSKMAAIGQLAGGVAHELNSPLGAITLFVSGAIDMMDKRPERAKERLEMVRTSAEQMKEIISKLLFYSRESPKSHVKTDLNKVVQDTLQVVGNQLNLDDIIIVNQLCPEALVNANANELQQVLTNLLLNARDAVMGRDVGNRWVVIETTADANEVVMMVSDSGLGISEEARKKVFDPFFTTKDVGQGTGLGLSISLQLVQAHGGRMEVDCQEGAGSRFRVHLPPFRSDPS